MSPGAPRLLISAGETSGDALGAEFLREIKVIHPGLRAFGMGGPAMEAEGLEVLVAADRSVVGLTEAIRHLPASRRALGRLRAAARERRPDLAVLIDYADFHQVLAGALAADGIPAVQYVSPQIWAWRRGRVRTLARRLVAVLTLLPFETEPYTREGLPAFYVGHPVLDRAAAAPGRDEARRRLGLDAGAPVVALLPGSRPGELARHVPPFVAAALRVRDAVPGAVFVLPLAPALPRADLDALLSAWRGPPLRVVEGRALECLAGADAALVASGTATLEAAVLGIPHVVAYRVSPPTWVAARLLVRGVRHIGMPNLLAGREVVPEAIQRLDPARLADPVVGWLRDPGAAEVTRTGLRAIRASLGPGGASRRAAEAVSAMLERPPVLPGPPPPTGREGLALLAVVATLTVARLWVAGKIGLSPDEAYYRVWAEAPASGYHAHAPMIAWWEGVSRALLGEGARAVRAPAVIAAGFATLLFHRLARRFAAPRPAAWATAVLATAPMYAAGALLAVPDAPLMLFWIAALGFAADLVEGERGAAPAGTRWIGPWWGFGIASGLALLSKYHGVLLVAGLVLALALRPGARPRSWTGPAVAAAAAALLFWPVVAWNARHEWISFALQVRHGFAPAEGSAAARLGQLALGQLALLTPVVPLAAVALWTRSVRLRRDMPRGLLLGAAFSAPVVLLFAASAWRAPVEPNWLAPAWPAVLLGLAAAGAARTLRAAALLGIAASVLIHVHALHPFLPVPPRADPMARLTGAPELARGVLAELARLPEGERGTPATVIASNYKDASLLALSLPGARAWTGGGAGLPGSAWVADLPGHGRTSQWDLWGLPPRFGEGGVVWVSPAGRDSRPRFCDGPGRLEGPEEVRVRYRGEVVRRVHLWRCGAVGSTIPPPP